MVLKPPQTDSECIVTADGSSAGVSPVIGHPPAAVQPRDGRSVCLEVFVRINHQREETQCVVCLSGEYYLQGVYEMSQHCQKPLDCKKFGSCRWI